MSTGVAPFTFTPLSALSHKTPETGVASIIATKASSSLAYKLSSIPAISDADPPKAELGELEEAAATLNDIGLKPLFVKSIRGTIKSLKTGCFPLQFVFKA